VTAFVAGGVDPDAQTAADIMVALTARPGEVASIDVGERGGIRGATIVALKKRYADNEPVFAVAGALGIPLTVRFVDAWSHSTVRSRNAALRGLPALCASWGLQKRDLRALGASLAVRAEVLAGNVGNDGQARDAHRAALRHGDPGRHRPAAENYARVNDPTAQLCAQLAELSAEDRQRVAALVKDLSPPSINSIAVEAESTQVARPKERQARGTVAAKRRMNISEAEQIDALAAPANEKRVPIITQKMAAYKANIAAAVTNRRVIATQQKEAQNISEKEQASNTLPDEVKRVRILTSKMGAATQTPAAAAAAIEKRISLPTAKAK